jgi:DNA-binding response OmpR family regulator
VVAHATILVVDDDETTVDHFRRMLTIAGYAVATAFTAEDALRWLQQNAPALILLDLRMPLMDGLGFLRRFRADFAAHSRVPIVIVTGDYFLSEDTRAELHTLGASLKFKPIWVDDLVELVTQALRDEIR